MEKPYKPIKKISPYKIPVKNKRSVLKKPILTWPETSHSERPLISALTFTSGQYDGLLCWGSLF
jgi:hypothetical protein